MYDFNADEIFEMAQQLERNGAGFYTRAAADSDDPEAQAFLQELAAMEVEHEKTFSSLRKQLSTQEKQSTVFDPQGEAAQYLKALADTRVFFEKQVDTSSFEAILKEAIVAEKDSIIFYLGMRDMVPDEKGKSRIDAIIQEEMGHIKVLSRKLADQRK
jgi:rubrerythrin